MLVVSRSSSAGLAALVVVGMAASAATTYSLAVSLLFDGRWWALFGASIPLSLAALAAALRVAGVELGGPELSREQHLAEALKAAPALVVQGVAMYVMTSGPLADFLPMVLLTVCHIAIGCNVRGAGTLVLAFSHAVRACCSLWGLIPGHKVFMVVHMAMALCVLTALSTWTKYFHDQRLFFFIANTQIAGGIFFEWYVMGILIGYRRRGGVYALMAACLGFLALMIYLIVLCQRRLRHLPPALGAAKFARLGFIRGDADCSSPVVRCQEMPAGAFGDVRKAARLIAVSHRWLSRDACDVCTPASPMGMRLGGMRRVLNTHFSPSRAEEPSFARRVRHALGRRAMGGWDVVVFFDFMGLPQVPRTAEEERVFRQCLPHMGTLYSMFPTMVLQEVLPENHGYFDSGWCYCEYQTAKLGEQLEEFSHDVVETCGATVRRTHGASIVHGISANDRSALDHLMSNLDAEVQRRRFHYPSDAEEVRRILGAFAMKRLLLNAIEDGNVEELRTVVARVQGQHLSRSTLDEPVNAALETPLHVAVRTGSLAAAQVLLDAGANPRRRNLRGDEPWQCFLFPRWSRAARLSRRSSPAPSPRSSPAPILPAVQGDAIGGDAIGGGAIVRASL